MILTNVLTRIYALQIHNVVIYLVHILVDVIKVITIRIHLLFHKTPIVF
jgi:hypothetical protein